MKVVWVLEKEMFGDEHGRLADAVRKAGQQVLWWRDSWLRGDTPPDLEGSLVFFHGSLGCAARIPQELPWVPGAICSTSGFCCSSWYPSASKWLVHERWTFTTVQTLVEDPDSVLGPLGVNGSFFVRPDSPLKPFSGRVLSRETLSLRALDHGFYYEDEQLPVVVAPIQEIKDEWRFIFSRGRLIACSGYQAETCSEKTENPPENIRIFAEGVASEISLPDPLYILDICETAHGPRLMEINPFSGADLYGCDRVAIVEEVTRFAAHVADSNNAKW